MEVLNKTIRKNGFTYEMVKRTDDVAIYAQYIEDEIIAYEVFIIEKVKESTKTIQGRQVTFRGGEKFPGNEDFGYTAYTCRTLEKAEKRMIEFTLRLELKRRGIGVN
jgi:hypothetical protein